jgi:predicted phage tail protein
MDQYRLEAATVAERLDAEAEEHSAAVRRDVQRAGNYVLGVVLFAVALFFAGMSTRLAGRGVRLAMRAVGCAVFAGTVAWIATFPVVISV